ncbi:MAG: hypothetical protein A2W91_03830 [Bacteroidetes bacterium GWF2_38_335]|nr:MAG: hypothetical protein A2W91_03830 [Bacteroidetes bacterium GWF2_38_335]OFY79082.1 MAG: hypothetical protein A2281_03165 [Bacteroidetes bacterium RIFOXYA12_FULL_38_20]HBS88833.1 hypothetical protein [Bacteroidales bacterium]
MVNRVFLKILFLFFIFICCHNLTGQVIPIINYNIDANGQAKLTVISDTEHYYLLKVRHNPDSSFVLTASLTIGSPDSTVISESLGGYPADHYQVLEYPIDEPYDIDGDGVDDITEFNNIPLQNPLNPAPPFSMEDGSVAIDSFSTFKELAIKHETIPWCEYLNDKDFTKFLITDFYTDHPNIYFINCNKYYLHVDFADAMGIEYPGDDQVGGHIIYHPSIVSANGTMGTFAFNFTNSENKNFEIVQRTHELLAANMLYLENNFSYYINSENEDDYLNDTVLYQNSRVSVLLESDVFAEIDYWGLNPAEGFGFFRLMTPDETPGARDIVLYESLPNSLPRVAGVITSVVQTPLSHVNLRAMQDNIPNAFIRDPLLNDTIFNLLNHYIYLKVEADKYTIREATLDEVNSWFESSRPAAEQIPPLNLSYTSILPLSEISFSMSDGFGAKCSNVAAMLTFGFPDETIPDGFGVPFYFYQEFMKYNNFFTDIDMMLNDPQFISDRQKRGEMLKDLRDRIREAEMPGWIMNELSDMQMQFPAGISIRCRSSSNNEDLPGFSGAGLYTSKTQHPDEGHISKSIKQVYASLWNLRAFEEREFYRVNHYLASMGVLCHPSFSDEKVNGVGVTTDPVYNTDNTFYLNSQLGEDLITNPDSNSVPEEILLYKNPDYQEGYVLIQSSNLVPYDSILISKDHMQSMRMYLSKIHDEFEQLYGAEGNATFAIDVEYKITFDNRLVIKQARPWVSYEPVKSGQNDAVNQKLTVFPNPAQEWIYVQCADCNLKELIVSNITGSTVEGKLIMNSDNAGNIFFLKHLPPGVYLLTGFSEVDNKSYSGKFIKL